MKHDPTDLIPLLTRSLAPDFRMTPLVLPDCPVFLAVAWPETEGATGRKPRLPAGRGLSAPQALVAAGAEAVELRASLAGRHSAAVQGLPRRDGAAMAMARDLWTGQDVPVAAQEVYLDCAAVLDEPLVCDATSSGCAAAATRTDASHAALWECIERDALALWWHGGLPARPLPLAMIDRLMPRLFWWLDGRDRLTRLFDITTDVGLPVVAAVSSALDGRHVALGTAARPSLPDAALSAVTEMVQTEVAMDEARAASDPEVLVWDAFATTARFEVAQGLEDAGSFMGPATTAGPLARLDEMGLRVLACDLTLPGDPLATMRVIVPGLCAMAGKIDTDRFRRLCPQAGSPRYPEPF